MIRLLIQVAFEKSIYYAALSAKVLDFKKKGETLKLLSLDFYHALLPSFSGAAACGWQTWKEESRKESKLAFMGDAKCARLHIRHCMSTYLIPVVAFRSRNQHPHFTAKQTELC